jgi:hypothetical protein
VYETWFKRLIQMFPSLAQTLTSFQHPGTRERLTISQLFEYYIQLMSNYPLQQLALEALLSTVWTTVSSRISSIHRSKTRTRARFYLYMLYTSCQEKDFPHEVKFLRKQDCDRILPVLYRQFCHYVDKRCHLLQLKEKVYREKSPVYDKTRDVLLKRVSDAIDHSVSHADQLAWDITQDLSLPWQRRARRKLGTIKRLATWEERVHAVLDPCETGLDADSKEKIFKLSLAYFCPRLQGMDRNEDSTRTVDLDPVYILLGTYGCYTKEYLAQPNPLTQILPLYVSDPGDSDRK